METKGHFERRLDYYLGQNGNPIPYEHIRVTDYRLAILQVLNEIHHADSYLLYKLTEQMLGRLLNYTEFKRDLTKIRKEAGYIYCPPKQFTINVDYKRLVYSLTKRGKEILNKREIPLQEWGLHSSSFPHDWMTSHCVASMRLAAGDAYISPYEIAKDLNLAKPFHFPISKERTLNPDFPVFGFSVGERFVIWETDCDTENYDYLLDKIDEYLKLDKPDRTGDNYYYKRLGIPSNYLCIVTTTDSHYQGILERAPRSEIVLYQKIPHFSHLYQTPEPYTHLWNEPWKRKGYADFVFSNPEEQ